MSCKNLRAELKRLIKRQKAASIAVREANAAVVAATSKLPPLYVDTKDAREARAAAKPLVDKAQKASDEFFKVNSDLVNKRSMVESSCKKR